MQSLIWAIDMHVYVLPIYSITAVCTYILFVCKKNDFRSVSFEKISVLDSYFIHRYIIIKKKSCSI